MQAAYFAITVVSLADGHCHDSCMMGLTGRNADSVHADSVKAAGGTSRDGVQKGAQAVTTC